MTRNGFRKHQQKKVTIFKNFSIPFFTRGGESDPNVYFFLPYTIPKTDHRSDE